MGYPTDTNDDPEKVIEAKYVTALRAIFEYDDKFVYNENDELTKVIISPEYPDKEATLKTPQLVVTNIAYQYNRQTSFFGNLNRDLYDPITGRPIGQEYVNVIPYSLSCICLAEFFISKDLANRVMNYVTFIASEVFDGLLLHISNVAKSPTVAQQQWPERMFETTVSIQGHVEWVGTKTKNLSALHLLNKIKINLNLI